jgi:hypothetical protein
MTTSREPEPTIFNGTLHDAIAWSAIAALTRHLPLLIVLSSRIISSQLLLCNAVRDS